MPIIFTNSPMTTCLTATRICSRSAAGVSCRRETVGRGAAGACDNSRRSDEAEYRRAANHHRLLVRRIVVRVGNDWKQNLSQDT
jgi:hypothetical protein